MDLGVGGVGVGAGIFCLGARGWGEVWAFFGLFLVISKGFLLQSSDDALMSI